MSLGAIVAVLLALVVVFIVGRAWFAIVEGALGAIKRLFDKKESAVWHTLPPKQTKEEREHD